MPSLAQILEEGPPPARGSEDRPGAFAGHRGADAWAQGGSRPAPSFDPPAEWFVSRAEYDAVKHENGRLRKIVEASEVDPEWPRHTDVLLALAAFYGDDYRRSPEDIDDMRRALVAATA